MTEAYERLFFALWPNAQVRSLLRSRCDQIAHISRHSRMVMQSNLHLTLHFLGNIPLQNVDCFIRQAKKVSGPAFNLKLTHVGYFKRPRVMWIGCDSVPGALTQLHKELGTMIACCGFIQETRPFKPHVTMARKTSFLQKQQAIREISWDINRFVLVQSVVLDNSVQYRVRASFPLQS